MSALAAVVVVMPTMVGVERASRSGAFTYVATYLPVVRRLRRAGTGGRQPRGKRGEMGSVGTLGLAHQTLDVLLDGADRHDQALGHLAVRQAIGDEGEHLGLPHGDPEAGQLRVVAARRLAWYRGPSGSQHPPAGVG